MGNFLRCLRVDLKRSCFSVRFLLSVILLVLLFLFNSIESIQGGLPVLWGYLNGTSLFKDTMPLLIPITILPCAVLFLEDWDTRFFRVFIARVGFYKYSISKIISLLIASLAVNFVSRTLFLIILFIFSPLEREDLLLNDQIEIFREQGIGSSSLNIYQMPSEDTTKSIFLSSIIVVVTFTLFCIFIGMIALIVSVWFTSIFMVVGIPIAVYYFILECCDLFSIPSKWNPILLGQASRFCDLGNSLSTFLFTTIYFGILFVIFGAILLWSIRRRISNE